MQYLKDEVRNSIIDQAVKEFKEKGYKGASIRTIAQKSGTSVGNLYKYFQGKDDLYETIIGSVYGKLTEYTVQFGKVEIDENAEAVFIKLTEKIMELFQQYKDELAILLNSSDGSKYENCKVYFSEFVTKLVTEKIAYKLSLEGKKLNDNFLIHLLCSNLVEDISLILKEKHSGVQVKNLIINLIDIFFNGLESKLYDENIK